MPKKSISVLKRIRQNEKRRIRNKAYKTRIKNLFKKLEKEKDIEKKKGILNLLYKYLDRAVKKGIIHENKGARFKRKAARFLAQK